MPERDLRAEPADRPRPQRTGRHRTAPRTPRPSGRPRRRLNGALRVAVLLALWVAIHGGGALAYFILTLPSTGELTKSQRRPSITILAANGSLLATYGDLFGQPLTLREMSPLPKR